MSNGRIFSCTIPQLQAGARGILAAVADHPELGPRLPGTVVTDTQALATKLTKLMADRADKRTTVGSLTDEQNAAITAFKSKYAAGRKSAREAFKGQTVKLHQDFQIGSAKSDPHGLQDLLTKATIFVASARLPENAGPLANVGWLDGDTNELNDDITAVGGKDDSQNVAKAPVLNGTTLVNTTGNGIYTNLRLMQNAANIQWPAENPANKGVRDEFLLGIFPPPPTTPTVPNIPKKVKIKPGDAGSKKAAATWNNSDGADDYTVTITNKATGQIVKTVTVTPSEADLDLAPLNSGDTAIITIIAHNETGDSKTSKPVIVKVP